jgi:DNA-binding transcriptional regulator YiaG
MSVIGQAIVENESPVKDPEIRFLRKRPGKKSSDFAKIIAVNSEQASIAERREINGGILLTTGTSKLIPAYSG